MTSPSYGQRQNPNNWQSKTPKGYSGGFQQQMTPDQINLMQQNIGMLGPDSYLSKLANGDQSQFEQMEAPAWQQLGAMQGQMASRFSGMGSGARRGSGFNNSMGQMGSDFAQQLQAKRMDYRRQAINDLMGFSSQILQQRPYEQFITPDQQSDNSGVYGLAGAGVGAVGGYMMGGPGGAYKGASLGYSVGSGMGR